MPIHDSRDMPMQEIEKFFEQSYRSSENPHVKLIGPDAISLIRQVIEIYARKGAISVMDIGGGKGWGRSLRSAQVSYKAMDILPDSSDPHIVCGDICKKNDHIDVGSYDVVMSKDTFEHLLEPWAAAQEMKRITKDQGLIICAAPFSWRYHPSPYDTYRFSHTGMRYLFERGGKLRTVFSGYIRYPNIRGFWRNRKDFTAFRDFTRLRNAKFREDWETIFVGVKDENYEFSEASLDSDFSPKHID